MRLRMIAAALFALMFAAPALAQLPTQAPPADPENVLLLDLSTGGRVAIQLRPDIAPRHVERIKTLTRQNFYNGLMFHRVIEGFMAQTGDPQGTGEGGSPLPDLDAEFNPLPHVRGVVSMARTNEPNSANSQFFIMLAPRMTLDRKYTAFGRVIAGMNFVDAIERGEPPASPTRIVRASIQADNIPPPVPGQPVPTFAHSVAAPPAAAAVPVQAQEPAPEVTATPAPPPAAPATSAEQPEAAAQN